MSRKLWTFVSACAVLTAAGTLPARAQRRGIVPDAPQLTEIVPPSGARGTTVELNLSGQKLNGTKQLMSRFSAYPDLIPPTDRGLKSEVTSANDGQVRARITIPKDAPSGLHEFRALTAQGVTTPEYFYVSDYAQVPEKEPNNSPAEATPITLPTTVAGTIGVTGDRDVYSFTAKAGQTIIFDVEGFKRYAAPQNNMEGIAYLDPFIVLQDATGKELAYDDDATKLDAFLAFKMPSDGKYFITLRDSVYRGRGDFRYCMTVGERPTVTTVFPPGGQAGTRVSAKVFGYNLNAQGATSISAAIPMGPDAGAQEYRLTTANGSSNTVPLMVGSSFETTEVEPNNRVQEATPVIIPVTCNGRFDTLDDVDAYRFQAQGGQTLVLSVEANRLGSAVDSYLTLMDRSGAVIARDDDGGGRSDARIEVAIPRTDEYVVFVRNQTKTGFGADFFYRLNIRPVRPSFDVQFKQDGVDRRGAPTPVEVDSVAVTEGGTTEFEVHVNRHEQQSGDVTISVNAPPGVTGIKIENLKREYPNGMQQPAKVTITPIPLVKNGESKTIVRLTAGEKLLPGTYLGVYLQLKGTAGSQPYTVNKPLWLTVSPK